MLKLKPVLTAALLFALPLFAPPAFGQQTTGTQVVADRVGTGLADLAGRNLAESFSVTLGVPITLGDVVVFEAEEDGVVDVSSVGNRYGFRGRPVDPETGLIYVRNRYYDPELGRFITRDPLGYVDGPSMYAYPFNNPGDGEGPSHRRRCEHLDGLYPMSNLRMTSLEAAVIQRMLADPQCTPSRRTVDPLAPLEVEERSVSEVGFITSFVRDTAAQLFGDNTSMRWGKVVGRLNSEVDVDFVVYVDDGYVTGVECVTFGGEPWPSRVHQFELTEITGR